MCFNDIKHACGARVRRQSLSCPCGTNSGDRECSLSCGTCPRCSVPAKQEEEELPSASSNASTHEESVPSPHTFTRIPRPDYEAKDARKMFRYSYP